jgi:hypothetical protein
MKKIYFCIVYIYMYFCRAIQCPVVADWRVLKPLWPCSSKSFKVIGQACRLISFHCSGSRARTGFGSGSGSPNIGWTKTSREWQYFGQSVVCGGFKFDPPRSSWLFPFLWPTSFVPWHWWMRQSPQQRQRRPRFHAEAIFVVCGSSQVFGVPRRSQKDRKVNDFLPW